MSTHINLLRMITKEKTQKENLPAESKRENGRRREDRKQDRTARAGARAPEAESQPCACRFSQPDIYLSNFSFFVFKKRE